MWRKIDIYKVNLKHLGIYISCCPDEFYGKIIYTSSYDELVYIHVHTYAHIHIQFISLSLNYAEHYHFI